MFFSRGKLGLTTATRITPMCMAGCIPTAKLKNQTETFNFFLNCQTFLEIWFTITNHKLRFSHAFVLNCWNQGRTAKNKFHLATLSRVITEVHARITPQTRHFTVSVLRASAGITVRKSWNRKLVAIWPVKMTELAWTWAITSMLVPVLLVSFLFFCQHIYRGWCCRVFWGELRAASKVLRQCSVREQQYLHWGC